jgi:hypothetical protein
MAQHLAANTEKSKRNLKKTGKSKDVSSGETRKCFFCKKKDHLRAECFVSKALLKNKSGESEEKDEGDGCGRRGDPMSGLVSLETRTTH